MAATLLVNSLRVGNMLYAAYFYNLNGVLFNSNICSWMLIHIRYLISAAWMKGYLCMCVCENKCSLFTSDGGLS